MFARSLYIAVILSTYLLNNQVVGVDLLGFHDSLSCAGSYFGCYGFNVNTCCSGFPAVFGYSARITNLPLGNKGDIFGGISCTTRLQTLYGEGSDCWIGGGDSKMRSMSWSRQGGRGGTNAVGECAQPNRFSFINETGQRVDIHVPKGQVDNIAEFFQKKDFKGLDQFERVKATE